MAGHRRATGKAPSLAYAGHALMENRNGLGVDCTAEPGHWHSPSAKRGFAMRTRASASQDPGRGQAHTTTPNSSRACRAQGVSPPVAQNTKRRGGSAIDARTTRHAGYGDQPADSQAHRTLVWRRQTASGSVAAIESAWLEESPLYLCLEPVGNESGAHGKMDLPAKSAVGFDRIVACAAPRNGRKS